MGINWRDGWKGDTKKKKKNNNYLLCPRYTGWERKWRLKGVKGWIKSFRMETLWCLVTISYRLLLVTPKRETLWKLKRAHSIDTGWKGIRSNKGGRKWINVSLLLYDGKMWIAEALSDPVKYPRFVHRSLVQHQTTFSTTFQWMN